MDNKKEEQPVEQTKPNDKTKVVASDFLKITDVETGKEIASKRG